MIRMTKKQRELMKNNKCLAKYLEKKLSTFVSIKLAQIKTTKTLITYIVLDKSKTNLCIS